ncbi:3-deoxy-D-manno-octulosonic acid transferase [Fibrella forsythiae]|uniref:3-deoxy-D-manno-octulosonic acid transferase n=1 Tax=Fibrella forsythiae TaxID=2817061 RepID=A0ABS3JH38_9BACT|nr:glycosyltransferase N-terminal domain-containing protein [Fibrella forsythiae]MBO0948718.1 3-deoxy-D-manno-octulosonic acid transferase [Fibrella forsythiae]
MQFLYNLSIFLYSALISLAAPFNRKARLLVSGRKNWRQPFLAKPLDPSRPVAWFHAASLGEFEQGRPVIEAFRATYPAYQVVLSFFSPSGYEVRKTYAGADVITYLPADTTANARDWMQQVRPQLAFFIKYEFWFHYLQALQTDNVPTISFSAIFRPNQLFFKPYGGFYRSLLTYFNHILVQNQESVDLLSGIGINRVTLAGDTRFDRVAQVAATKRAIPEAAAFVADLRTLVVGSAWAADMAVLIPMLNAFTQPLRVIIAPHEIHDDEIEGWRAQLASPSVRFSTLNTAPVPSDVRYLFIDNIGMLTSLYQYGTVAYIGGAFGKGLHNCLEAATFGLPLLFGPNHQKFQEALDLVQQGGAFQVRSVKELTTAFTKLYASESDRERAGAVCRNYVLNNVGATGLVMHAIEAAMHPA